ncbi:MAG TPA: NifU family protein [Actinomycetota bacterium]|nr:NifU family protein [Actinomycetota bacterium]
MSATGGAAASAVAPSGQEAPSPQQLMDKVQELAAKIDGLSDPTVRKTAQDFMRSIMELYGLGLAKVVQVLSDSGDAGAPMRAELIQDGVFASLLLIHDLYPVPLDERVEEGLDSVRPYLASHGGAVELVRIKDGVAYLRLEGSCKGCPASQATLELAIKKALDEAAPDLVGLQVEGVIDDAPKPGKGPMLPVVNAQGKAQSAAPKQESAWFEVEGTARVPAGKVMGADLSGFKLLVANVDGTMLAYKDTCAGCGSPISGGELVEGVLACPTCSRKFFLPRAGRSLDEDRLHLVPIPLLYDENVGVRVALAV